MRILATLALGLAMTTAAHAGECITVSEAADQLKVRWPLAVIAGVNKADLPAFMKRFNADPPASHLPADAVLTASQPGSNAVAMFFFSRGCVIAKVIYPRSDFDRLMTGDNI